MTTAERLRDAPKHPHLVAVLRASQDAVEEEDVIANGGIAAAEVFFRLSLAARLRIVVDVLAALSALHTLSPRAIIHGGVLLRATFIDTNGRAKLGHAYAQSSFMKKDSYAPESLLGDDAAIGARTDVYGAGVMLWEAITGHELFGIDAPEAIVKKQLGGRIAKALPPARENWAGALLPVVDRALAVNPNDRYASIAEMAAALRIAVRARLMTHADVVEEIWPAATTPKVQSGVQPAGDPIVADASFEREVLPPIVVPTPSAPIAVVRVPVVAPSHRTRALVFGASIAAAVIAVWGVASVVHMRASRVATLHRDTATLDNPASAPAVAAPPEIANRPERDEDVKPVRAPAAATEVKPPPPLKEIRKAKTKSRFYDPSTI